MTFPYTIALCCNGSLLPGLHVTLASLTRRLKERDKVALHLFVRDIDVASQNDLRQTVAEAGDVGYFQFHNIDLNDFDGLQTLHGDRTAYFRLKLADLLPDAPVILYLDSDLAIHADVCEVFALPLGEAPLGAVGGGAIRYSIDAEVFQTLGFSGEEIYFNSGVLLINATYWRQANVARQVFDFARAHPTLLRSHDQTILNALFAKTYYPMPRRYNVTLGPNYGKSTKRDGVYHFVGSPKPWDPLGNILNTNWHLWKEAIVTSRFRWPSFIRRHGGQYASRVWALRYSYLREFKFRLGRVLEKARIRA